jgi:hypothetical protein
MFRKTLGGAVALLLVAGGVALAAPAANATGNHTPPVCVPSDAIPAWTEDVPDIEHPAVYETVVVTPATEGTPAIWANFSPNDEHATFIGPPTYPTDERGTWHDHGTLPPGQAGEDGVYANGNPDKGGNWFYRQAAVEGTPEVTEERLVTEAWTEVTPDIEHPEVPAVTCPPDEEEPPVTAEQCPSVATGPHSTNLNPNGWTFAETRATGHNEYVEGGLNVYTEGSTSTDKAAGYIGATFDLADAGLGFGINMVNVSGGVPGLQMLVDLDNDGDNEGFLVHEPVYGADTLWLSANWGGADLSGAPTAVNGGGTGKGGHINAWLAEYPSAKVSAIGYSLGSGVLGNVTITSIVVGCTSYTFDKEEVIVVPEKPADIVTVDEDEVTDCEADTVTTTVTTTTIGHVLVDNVWVEAEPVVTVTSSERPADDVECPVPPVEEPEEPVTPEKPEEPAPAAQPPLAATGLGFDMTPITLLGGGVALAGALALAIAALVRRFTAQD